MVLFYMSLILHPRAENFLSSVWITGGKFDNRLTMMAFVNFDIFQTKKPFFVIFQLIKINWNYRWMQVDLLCSNGELLTYK